MNGHLPYFNQYVAATQRCPLGFYSLAGVAGCIDFHARGKRYAGAGDTNGTNIRVYTA